MLTQYQTTEPQAVTLAACPRPHALAVTPFSTGISAFSTSISAPLSAVTINAVSINAVSINAVSLAAVSINASVPAPRVPGAWSQATAPIAAPALGSVLSGPARRPGSADERPQAGYGETRVLTDAARAAVGSGNGNGVAGIAMAGSSNKQDKQYEQHLTARREPVTWRPPR